MLFRSGQASAPILHLSVLQRPVFLLNSRLGLFTVAACAAPLLPKLRGQYAEFLNNPSPVGLRILSSSTCVGLRYGRLRYTSHLFSPLCPRTSLLNFSPLRPGLPTPGLRFHLVSVCLKFWRLRNLSRMCIDYACRPRLSSRLTLGGLALPRKP